MQGLKIRTFIFFSLFTFSLFSCKTSSEVKLIESKALSYNNDWGRFQRFEVFVNYDVLGDSLTQLLNLKCKPWHSINLEQKEEFTETFLESYYKFLNNNKFETAKKCQFEIEFTQGKEIYILQVETSQPYYLHPSEPIMQKREINGEKIETFMNTVNVIFKFQIFEKKNSDHVIGTSTLKRKCVIESENKIEDFGKVF